MARLEIRVRIGVAGLLMILAIPCAAIAASCPPDGWTRASLIDLKNQGFRTSNAVDANELAIDLLPCLSDPDPMLRDQVAFTAISTWGRSKQLTDATALKVLGVLQPKLQADASDQNGFDKPFAALTLAEVARMDRLEPFLSDAQRQSLLRTATEYMRSITDYRGFDATEGWRHGVAHAADLLVQLSLQPAFGKSELDRILAAIATQVSPRSTHFYVYGEPARLAAPVYWIAQRNVHTASDWRAWLKSIIDPAPLPSWSDVFESQPGLAKRHNTVAFLQALFSYAHQGTSEAAKAELLPALDEAIRTVP